MNEAEKTDCHERGRLKEKELRWKEIEKDGERNISLL